MGHGFCMGLHTPLALQQKGPCHANYARLMSKKLLAAVNARSAFAV